MKKLVSLLLALILTFSLSATAYAEATFAPPEDEVISELADPENPTRLEETCWYYRTTDTGLFQKRLWSITYGYWKTDWITIGYVP